MAAENLPPFLVAVSLARDSATYEGNAHLADWVVTDVLLMIGPPRRNWFIGQSPIAVGAEGEHDVQCHLSAIDIPPYGASPSVVILRSPYSE